MTTLDPDARCPRCLFINRVCLCADVPMVATKTRFIIVRHHKESGRSSNSARLAALAMPNCTIVDHGEPGRALEIPDFSRDNAWLLWPEGEPRSTRPEPAPATVVVVDATWSQARRMRQRIEAVRGLPPLRLPDLPVTTHRMRASPGQGMVSTIEAIAGAVRLLESDAAADALEALFALATERQYLSGRPRPVARYVGPTS